MLNCIAFFEPVLSMLSWLLKNPKDYVQRISEEFLFWNADPGSALQIDAELSSFSRCCASRCTRPPQVDKRLSNSPRFTFPAGDDTLNGFHLHFCQKKTEKHLKDAFTGQVLDVDFADLHPPAAAAAGQTDTTSANRWWVHAVHLLFPYVCPF